MTLRPSPGPQLAAGRLRVDAAKAIAKLREYQLVDRTAWILEAIRAAVAAGATRIDLQGDANDVWLSWAGEPWPADDLPRLFDELVSPEPGAARYHMRLLAAAINSALGANPAYVDVYAVGDTGAVRARYTPDVLEVPTGELADSPLRQVHAHATAAPVGAPRGMHVHYRRRASLEVVSYWLRRTPPPELEIARWACPDITVPIRIGDEELARAVTSGDLVRVPLGADVDGWIALTATAAEREAALDIAERGVRLESSTLDVEIAEIRAPIPLRVFVDAPRMPTNASRSEVRRDAHPLSTAARRAREQLPALIAKVVEELQRADADPRVRDGAIRLLGAIVAGIRWPHNARQLEGPLRALAELPLVRDATGTPRPLAWRWSGMVYTGREPLSAELAPWLEDVLWAPPGETMSWLDRLGIEDVEVARQIRHAKQERRAQKRFYKHAPRAPSVLGNRRPRVRARLGAPLAGSCIPDDVFDGLAGEVCVYPDRPGGELTVLFEGRDIETVHFDSALAFAVVIDSARVQPTNRFRGVMRDTEYARVERAMRAGIVRAIEAVVLARPVDGYQAAAHGDPDRDLHLVKHGLLLARNLGARVAPVFAGAALWRTTEGRLTIDELRQHAVLGVTASHATVPRLAGRVVVYADATERALLADVLPGRFVHYAPDQLRERIEPDELAREIMYPSPHALALRDGELVGAIVPAEEARLVLFHRGRRLESFVYVPTLAPCTIAVDSDRVVPGDDWETVVDDAGLRIRDYRDFEHRLAYATVRALLGERPRELAGADVELTSSLGRWLCFSLIGHPDPAAVLGDELLARLRTTPLFRVLGEPHRHSIDELAVMFPAVIYYVESATEPVAGFPLLLADLLVARTIAKLANRRFHNATHELAQRRRQLARELRLASHRAKPPYVHEHDEPAVELVTSVGSGTVAVGRDTLAIEVLVEGRLFQRIVPANELPLAIVVELRDLDRTDETFEHVRPDVVAQLVIAANTKAGELLAKLAETIPTLLADATPARTLLVRYVEKQALAPELRDHLARTIRWLTIQGTRATFVEARSGPLIQTSSWHGEWLGPDGDPHPTLDQPILAVPPSPEIGVVLGALGNIVDVTAYVEKLQAQRRIARGLLPAPTVPSADPALTRKLADLGPGFRHLGPGEAALAADGQVLVHVHGELRVRAPLACTPGIHLAIEAADLVEAPPDLIDRRLGADAQALALALAHDVLGKLPAASLPVEIRRGLRGAILGGKLAEARDAAVFETASGTWIDLAAVQAQRELFGQLWCVPAIPHEATPLDERRIVLVLSGDEQRLAAAHGIPVIDATAELALDATTRRNRARPAVESLAIPAAIPALATVTLDGDGISAAYGEVAVLAPGAVAERRLRMSRALHPFDDAPDPCRWPTYAVLDDARFVPDRCWALPEEDAVYKEAIERVRRASDEALREIAQPPANALASMRIVPWTYGGIASVLGTDVQLRGALWISGPPVPAMSPAVRVIEAGGERLFVPLRGLGLTGIVYVHAPSGWRAEKVLEDLCQHLHARLVRELAAVGRRDPDLVAAHVAWALALERIAPADAKHVVFTCFRPAPLDATALHALLRSSEPVVVVASDSRHDGPALVDDGSETARVIRIWLGTRTHAAPRRRADTAPPPPPVERPIARHPLQGFVDRLHARIAALGVAVPRWRIVNGRDEPIVDFADGVLELAGDNDHVLALAADASRPDAPDALDALAAHCITVLNVALTSITDAAEAAAIGRLLG